MKNFEKYKNQVELLKQALLFYADKINYHGEMGNAAMIDLDEHGSQARFALEQLKKVEEINEGIDNDYLKYVSEETSQQETTEGIINLINEIKKVEDDKII